MHIKRIIATSLVIINALATVVPVVGHGELAQITSAVTQERYAEAKEVKEETKKEKIVVVESNIYPIISAENEKIGVKKYTTTTVNVRKKSNTDSSILVTLNPNVKVEELYTYKDWSYVCLKDDTYGFIKSEYLSKKKTPTSKLNRWKIDLTKDEIDLLAKVVFRECNLESYKGQVAVVETIFNRMVDGYWGDSLYEVLSSPNQFTCWNTVSTATPTDKNYKVIYDVLNGKTNVLGMDYLYFSRGGHMKHSGVTPIGEHQFCKKG